MKKATALFLSIFLVLCLLTPAASADSAETGFTDTHNHWSAPYAVWAKEQGLMSGVTESLFAPDRTMTRAMAVTVLYRMGGETVSSDSVPFTDVPKDSYYAEAVSWATQKGLVNGVSEKRFAPTSDIRLWDFITMLHRYELYKNPKSEPDPLLNGYYQAAMDWAVNHSIVLGDGDHRISAKAATSRGQSAAILKRYAEIDTYEDPGILYDVDPLTVEKIVLRQLWASRTLESEQEIQESCEKLNGYRYAKKSYLPPIEGWSNGMDIYRLDGTNLDLGEISIDYIKIGNVIFHNAEPSNGNRNSYFTDDWFQNWFPSLDRE